MRNLGVPSRRHEKTTQAYGRRAHFPLRPTFVHHQPGFDNLGSHGGLANSNYHPLQCFQRSGSIGHGCTFSGVLLIRCLFVHKGKDYGDFHCGREVSLASLKYTTSETDAVAVMLLYLSFLHPQATVLPSRVAAHTAKPNESTYLIDLLSSLS